MLVYTELNRKIKQSFSNMINRLIQLEFILNAMNTDVQDLNPVSQTVSGSLQVYHGYVTVC